MPYSQSTDFLNVRTMRSREAVAFYSGLKGLYPAEELALASIEDTARGKAILDLGVGGGRTVPALREISKNYIGLDYSEDMVAGCLKKFPDADFVHGDARDMSQFDDNSFFLIVFSNEGICMVDHEGRVEILEEIRRLLCPGGIYMFSSYNTASPAHDAEFKCLKFEMTGNPIKLAVRACRCTVQNMYAYLNRLRFKKHEVRLREYSIISDVYHYHSTLQYYISIENQKKQLRAAGFKDDIDVIDTAGFVSNRESREKSLYYLARA